VEGFPPVLVSLCLSGDFFDEDHCARFIGLEPDHVFKQKRPELMSDPLLDHQCFSYQIDVPDCDSVDAALTILLEGIWPHRERILQYADEYILGISFCCYVRIDEGEENPLYDLERSTLEKLVKFNARYSLAIDDFRE